MGVQLRVLYLLTLLIEAKQSLRDHDFKTILGSFLDILDHQIDRAQVSTSMCTSIKRLGATSYVESFLSRFSEFLPGEMNLRSLSNASHSVDSLVDLLNPVSCIQHPHEIPLNLFSTFHPSYQERAVLSTYESHVDLIIPSALCESERRSRHHPFLKGSVLKFLDGLSTNIRLSGVSIEILDSSSQSVRFSLPPQVSRLVTVQTVDGELTVTEWYYGNLRSVRNFGNITAEAFIQFYTETQDLYSPDTLFVSRYGFSSCDALSRMNLIHSVMKFIVFPVTPTVPPPIQSRSDEGICSVSAVEEILRPLYELVVVRPDGFAIFSHRSLAPFIPTRFRPSGNNVFDVWKSGFACNPRSLLFELAGISKEEFDMMVSMDVAPETKARQLKLVNFTISKQAYGSDIDYMYESIELSTTMRLVQARGRAHCYENLCDCVPPFRGHLCQKKVNGVDDIVLNYLTTNSSDDIHDLGLSLESFQESFPDTHHPIIVFYDSLISTEVRVGLVKKVPKLNLWFVNQFFAGHPDIIDPPLHYRPLGYRHMCRFESGAMFRHPALAGFEYMVRLDTDNYFPKQTLGDPFAVIKNPNGPALMYSVITVTYGNVLNGLLELVALYVGSNSSLDRLLTGGMKLLQISSPPFLFKASFFRSKLYMDFFNFVDSIGFYENGFLGNTVLTLGAFLFGSIGQADIPVAHDGSCKCGSEDSGYRCIKQPVIDTRWIRNQSEKWICVLN